MDSGTLGPACTSKVEIPSTGIASLSPIRNSKMSQRNSPDTQAPSLEYNQQVPKSFPPSRWTPLKSRYYSLLTPTSSSKTSSKERKWMRSGWQKSLLRSLSKKTSFCGWTTTLWTILESITLSWILSLIFKFYRSLVQWLPTNGSKSSGGSFSGRVLSSNWYPTWGAGRWGTARRLRTFKRESTSWNWCTRPRATLPAP